MAQRTRSAVGRKLSEYQRKRDFSRTREPSGERDERGAEQPKRTPERANTGTLRFVIQKHAASHLHFDFRLELGGVMKSWAVPKGPNLDPSVKRLAMEVEDHPIAYNTFEGTIPKGEYGGGTVMLWDRGTYTANDTLPGESDSEALRRGFEKGKLDFTLHGERLHGSWALVRTRGGDRAKPQWLLIKHRDRFAQPGSDIVAAVDTSVDTGRSMDEIAFGRSRVWHSNRKARGEGSGGRTEKAAPSPAASALSTRPAQRRATRLPGGEELRPMLASIGTSVPEGEGWTFEPKYDGIRVLAYVTPKAVKLVTRNGKDKATQFPEVVEALRKLAARSRRPLVLDGEIVALDNGAPARFQELQSRMHVKDAEAIAEHSSQTPAALVMFDILLDGDDVLLHDPWSERRRRLEARLRNRTSARLRLGDTHRGGGEEMLERARAAGWEGVIAKHTDSLYTPGVRSDAWLKLKVEFRQEFVVGGFTEPRNTREHVGALLLGYFDRDRFLYVGHTGGGFTRAGLKEMGERLKPLARKTSPFEETPRTNQRAHWVRPEVVVEVKFSEWTADGKLRQPIYLGTRDDKDPREVGLEPVSVQSDDAGTAARTGRVRRSTKRARASGAARESTRRRSSPTDVVAQLDAIERAGGDGTLRLPRGVMLEVSSLGKVFFPGDGYTKGDVMRYYARVAPVILPAIADRPLVLKRYPNGIEGESFFQQNAPPPEQLPDGVRVETIRNDAGERQRRIVGGDLPTLLYT
ncbi:MAG: non-homologous end-joining DNA ligase, partial [Gemmatimonadaceae bacterium]